MSNPDCGLGDQRHCNHGNHNFRRCDAVCPRRAGFGGRGMTRKALATRGASARRAGADFQNDARAGGLLPCWRRLTIWALKAGSRCAPAAPAWRVWPKGHAGLRQTKRAARTSTCAAHVANNAEFHPRPGISWRSMRHREPDCLGFMLVLAHKFSPLIT